MYSIPKTFSRFLPAVLAIASSASVAAADYPTKPIRLIVPFAPGGASDQLARAIQRPVSKVLRQPVIVKDKPGAGGSIGVDATATAVPDGHTGVFGNSGPSATASLMRKLPYDPLKDFRSISTVAFAPLAL
jgi:tripartite-type tricarboxylate transporter receptor subunit TctC